MKKKFAALVITAAMAAATLAGCGSSSSQAPADAPASAETTDNTAASAAETTEPEADATEETAPTAAKMTGDISILTREDGSGTRGAFIELFGVQEEQDGEKVDMTTEEANITNSTSVMMTTVADDEYAIGYISLGSLDDSVKAVKIDGAEASVEDINDGTYKIYRPFNIATKGDVSEAAQDFINYIMSKDGQAVIEENKYISVGEPEEYKSNGAEGKVVVAGSSSVSPVMEKLKEAYEKVNDKVEIEIQTSDSTTGMQNTIDGICDIGMASRELKDSETEAGLTATVIANDGIAVVVNNDNPIDELTSDQVKSVFTGETTTWADLEK